jgi:hypothetical protein
MPFCRFIATIAGCVLTGTVLMAAPAETVAAPPYAAAPEGVKIERDVAFLAPDRTEKLDMYLPAVRRADVRSPAAGV